MGEAVPRYDARQCTELLAASRVSVQHGRWRAVCGRGPRAVGRSGHVCGLTTVPGHGFPVASPQHFM